MSCHGSAHTPSALCAVANTLWNKHGWSALGMVVSLMISVGSSAEAQGTPPPNVAAQSPAPVAAPAPPPSPYSLPWQLRPAVIGTVLRSDTSVAFYENPAAPSEKSGNTIATTLLGSYKLTPNFAPLVRMALVQNEVPGPMLGSGMAFVNPIVGAMYGDKLPANLRYTAILGAAIPIGMGGDKAPSMDTTAAAAASGIAARSNMDNAMFAVNYLTALAGIDLAYVANKLTVQVEATVLQLFRTRNEQVATALDSTRTNFTAGMHVGYFLASFLSLGGEIRHQRWLSTPKAIEGKSELRDTTTFAVGPRFHVKVANTWIRPGLSYSRALDNPLKDQAYNILQADVPVVF